MLARLLLISHSCIPALVVIPHLWDYPPVPESCMFYFCRLLSTITEPTEGGACEPPSTEETSPPSLGTEESDPDKAEHGGIKKVCFKVSEEDQEDSGHDTMSFRDSYRSVWRLCHSYLTNIMFRSSNGGMVSTSRLFSSQSVIYIHIVKYSLAIVISLHLLPWRYMQQKTFPRNNAKILTLLENWIKWNK